MSLTLTNGGSSAGSGGAVFFSSSGGTLDIADTTFSNNSTGLRGGALLMANGNGTITNSLFTGNSAGGDGGAIYSGATMVLSNTMIDGNSSNGSGGGVKVAGVSLTVTSSTITNNHADADGADATLGGGLAGLTVLTNTVVAGNTSGTGLAANDVLGNAVSQATSSFFGAGVSITSDGGGNIIGGGDPLLGSLANHGGTVATRDILLGSALIDAGSNAGASGLTADANGNIRITNGTVDIGATEVQELVVTTASDVVDANDGVLSLREAVALANAGDGLDRITFDGALANQTLTLTGGQLVITSDVTINGDTNGDHKADFTISGNDTSRIFGIFDCSVALASLTLTDGYGRSLYSVSGGAIYADLYSRLSIADCTIQDSYAKRGGAITCHGTTLTIVNSTLSGNKAGIFGGGALWMGYGMHPKTATFVNTTIHGNSSVGDGGAISNESNVTMNIFSSTITDNTTGGAGGGISTYTNNFLNITNSVIAGNTSGDIDEPKFTLVTAKNSIFGSDVPTLYGNSYGNVGNVTNLGLGELLDNGGTVRTLSPLDGSVMIGAGSIAALPLDTYDIDHDGNTTEVLPIDGRGGLRLVGGSVDIGAVEQKVNERIIGTEVANTIVGGLGRDVLVGREGNDTITGGNGKDNLAGGEGADSLDGGSGRDTATYSGSGLGVTVNLATGTASGGHADGDILVNIENLIGSRFDDSLTGNALANVLSGGGGDDRLNGGAGHDTLTGGLGSDTFVLTRLAASSDTITDFEVGVDTLEISASAGGLAADTLDPARFAFNAAGTAGDLDDRFVYNTTTGELIFDRNGSDPGGNTVIAILQGIPTFTAGDILIV